MTTAEKRLYDYLGSFPAGTDSNTDPLLLPKEQLAFMANGTNRGDFVRQRPPFNKLTLAYSSPLVAASFQTGLFQAWGYFNPSPGQEYLMLVISGQLFQISISGSAGTVTQVALPDAGNSPSTPNQWLWQSERWLIWNDGVQPPMIYDGVTARRSLGDSANALGVTAKDFTAPNTGQPVSGDVELVAPYTGPLGVSVLINSATYAVKSAYTLSGSQSGNVAGYVSAELSGISGSYTPGTDNLIPGAHLSLNNSIMGCILSGSAYLSDAVGNNTGGAIVNWPSPISGTPDPSWQFTLSNISVLYGIIDVTAATHGNQGYSGTFYGVVVGDQILIGGAGGTSCTVDAVVSDSSHIATSITLHPNQNSSAGQTIPATSFDFQVSHTFQCIPNSSPPPPYLQTVTTLTGVDSQPSLPCTRSRTTFPSVPTQYFTFLLTQSFTGNAGDTLSLGSALMTVASFSGSRVTCYMNDNSQTGNAIPVVATTSTVPTDAVIVTDTTANGSLTVVGTFPLASGNVPPVINSNYPVGASMNFPNTGIGISGLFVSGLAPGQIVQVTNPSGSGGTATMLLFVQSVGGSTAPGYGTETFWIAVVNETDTPGAAQLAGSPVYPIPELPVGRMGVYAQGRNWMCLADGQSFIASDIVGSSSGTPGNNYLDAVLKVSQNQELAGGGTFRLPGSGTQIRAMCFIPTLDVSLGQGPVQILTQNTVFSCSAPPDITTWASLTSPIVTVSLIGSGAVSQDGVVTENLDLLWRTPDGYIRSLMLARLDFQKWGNTPASLEVIRSLESDDLTLLGSESVVVFGNRMLVACQPSQKIRGAAFAAAVSLNLDPLSTIQKKQPAAWEGEWEAPVNGLMGFKTGEFSGVERCFMLCLNSSNFELHEVLQDGAAINDDGATQVIWNFESPMIFKDSPTGPRQYKRLINGEFSIMGLESNLEYQVFYKSDQYPTWVPWYSSSIAYLGANDPGFRSRLGIGMPPAPAYVAGVQTGVDPANNRPLREGYNFQLKFVFTGFCVFMGARFMADWIDEPEFAQPG